MPGYPACKRIFLRLVLKDQRSVERGCFNPSLIVSCNASHSAIVRFNPHISFYAAPAYGSLVHACQRAGKRSSQCKIHIGKFDIFYSTVFSHASEQPSVAVQARINQIGDRMSASVKGSHKRR